MLPTPDAARPSLADVLLSEFDSVQGRSGRIDLPRSRKAIVVLVDGLGAAALAARSGHARRLAGMLGKSSILAAGFPTTTAAAITSLTTGTAPGRHGIVGYTVYDPDRNEVVNQLSGLDRRADIAEWQREPTLFERAEGAGLDAVAIGPERYRTSGFSAAALRGARYLAGKTMADRFELAVSWAREPGSGIAYVYVPELDSAAHAHGWQSAEWTRRLEQLESAATTLDSLPRDVGALLTADHGVLDVPEHGHVQWDAEERLVAGVLAVAGDPRCLHLHAEPGAAETVLAAWDDAEGERSWVVSRAEAIEAGWFGDVSEHVIPRIGDVLVAARKQIAYWSAAQSGDAGMTMVGQHGSWTPEELRVPLLRFGSFAR
jgi:hypothetical protein